MEFRPFSGVIVGGQRLTPHEAEVLIDNLLGERVVDVIAKECDLLARQRIALHASLKNHRVAVLDVLNAYGELTEALDDGV